MRKISVILLYFIAIAFGLFILGIVNNYVETSTAQLSNFSSIFVVYTIITLTLFLIWIFKLEKQEPKTEVKIVYKTVDKEKEKKAKKEKEKKVLQEVISKATEDLQKFNDPQKYTDKLFDNLSKAFNIVQGMFFIWDENKKVFRTLNSFAYYAEETEKQFALGEGITGQVAKNKKFLIIDNVPENYIIVFSGLGSSNPKYLTFLPIVYNDKTIAVIEFATFEALPDPQEQILEELNKIMAPQISKFVNSQKTADEKKA